MLHGYGVAGITPLKCVLGLELRTPEYEAETWPAWHEVVTIKLSLVGTYSEKRY